MISFPLIQPFRCSLVSSTTGILKSRISKEDAMKSATRIILVVLFTAALSQGALAQQNPAGAPPGPADQGGSGKTLTPEQFQERKARVLKMIEERMTMLNKAKACAEAAQTAEELQKCRPERPMGMGPGGMRRAGPGMQGGGPRNQQAPMPPADQPQ
jgi:hypothetical protein